MKANEFVKEVGWILAKEYADECPDDCNYLHHGGFYKITNPWRLNEKHVLVKDLKRLILSHDLVRWHGGLGHAKSYFERNSKRYLNEKGWDRLKQAIADVESCQ